MTIEFQPYVGPRPFGREDQAVFFGRVREAKDLLSLVVAEGVVLLYSQSGVGKTSLFNAKLIPLLEEKGFEVLPLARVQGLIPKGMESEEIPNLYVFNTLMSWAKSEHDPKRLLRLSLADFLGELKRPIGREGRYTPRILIFDQFEELFSSYKERWRDRENFFEQIANVLDEDPLLRVVFAMREEYIAQLGPYTRLLPEKLRTHYRLERLRAEAACLAVEGPLLSTEYSFAEGVASKLVQQLLNIRVEDITGEIVEAVGEHVEPVQLQVVCQSLWLNLPREVTVITSNHLMEFGDVEESLRSLYERAIEVAERETGVEEADLRKWFKEKLITPAETRGTVFRDKEDTEGIPNLAVDVLEAQHIIRAEMRAGARWYELTHDCLIEPIRKSNEVWQERQIEEELQRARIEDRAKRAKIYYSLVATTLGMIIIAVFALLSKQEINIFKEETIKNTGAIYTIMYDGLNQLGQQDPNAAERVRRLNGLAKTLDIPQSYDKMGLIYYTYNSISMKLEKKTKNINLFFIGDSFFQVTSYWTRLRRSIVSIQNAKKAVDENTPINLEVDGVSSGLAEILPVDEVQLLESQLLLHTPIFKELDQKLRTNSVVLEANHYFVSIINAEYERILTRYLVLVYDGLKRLGYEDPVAAEHVWRLDKLAKTLDIPQSYDKMGLIYYTYNSISMKLEKKTKNFTIYFIGDSFFHVTSYWTRLRRSIVSIQNAKKAVDENTPINLEVDGVSSGLAEILPVDEVQLLDSQLFLHTIIIKELDQKISTDRGAIAAYRYFASQIVLE